MAKQDKLVERMNVVERALDEYEGRASVPVNIPPGIEAELQEYLTMGRDTLEKLGPTECATIGVRLAQFATYVQRLWNRERARHSWAERVLHETIAPALINYDKVIAKAEYKVALICKENEAAKKIYDMAAYAKERTQRLEELASSIRYLADTLKNLQIAKVSDRKNYGQDNY